MTAEQDCRELVDAALIAAKADVADQGGFAPFGLERLASGERVVVGVEPGTAGSPSLEQTGDHPPALRRKAASGELAGARW
jgi:hypothetical protein